MAREVTAAELAGAQINASEEGQRGEDRRGLCFQTKALPEGGCVVPIPEETSSPGGPWGPGAHLPCGPLLPALGSAAFYPGGWEEDGTDF